MEREIIFLRMGKGHNDDKNTDYYFIEYLKNDNQFRPHRDYVSAEQYQVLCEKTQGKNLKLLTGILSINNFDKVIVGDIKLK